MFGEACPCKIKSYRRYLGMNGFISDSGTVRNFGLKHLDPSYDLLDDLIPVKIVLYWNPRISTLRHADDCAHDCAGSRSSGDGDLNWQVAASQPWRVGCRRDADPTTVPSLLVQFRPLYLLDTLHRIGTTAVKNEQKPRSPEVKNLETAHQPLPWGNPPPYPCPSIRPRPSPPATRPSRASTQAFSRRPHQRSLPSRSGRRATCPFTATPAARVPSRRRATSPRPRMFPHRSIVGGFYS